MPLLRPPCLPFAISLLCASPALACPPPPGPPPRGAGESAERYATRLDALAAAARRDARQREAARQADLWMRSPLIFVARVEEVRPAKVHFYGPGQSARIRPIHWIRGQGGARSFWLRYAGETSCGPYGGGDAVDGRIGQDFVVFAALDGGTRALTSGSVRDSVSRANAVDARIVAALSDRRAGND